MSAVGFVGLGIMGEGMAARLVSQGIAGSGGQAISSVESHRFQMCCLARKFPDKTVIIKETAKEVVEACAITYCMLSTPEASRMVFEGDTGVLAGVSEGKAIVDCATLAEADMVRMDNDVRDKGGLFLEAPVSGSKGPALDGSLIFLCAGSQELFDQIKDDGLNAMGKASHFSRPRSDTVLAPS
jgi:3-hydroxyisobutyrate dehydrogenase-like beta-hydroxyacid dehydrogenase